MATERLVMYGAVGLGSLLGGALRAYLAVLLPAGVGLPLGTLLANASGSLLAGAYLGMTEPGGRLHHGPMIQHMVIGGFCGGYTTFSLFALETVMLVQSGRSALAFANFCLSVASWWLAVWAGYALARRLPSTPSRTLP